MDLMRKFRFIGVILALLFIVSIVSCAGMKTTEEGAYYKALGVWYDTTLQFKRYYLAADEDTQAKWDDEFVPLLLKAKDVLNIWYVHMDDGQSTARDYEEWLGLKNELLFYMATNIQGKT
jgi:hypothetical protein